MKATLNVGLCFTIFIFFVYGVMLWYATFRHRLTGSLTCLSDRNKLSSLSRTLYWSSPILLFALWGFVSYSGIVSSQTMPSPDEFFSSLWKITISGVLPIEALISFKRIVVGFCLACLIGVPLGLAAGTFVIVRQLVMPINSFLRYIPPTAFISLLIIYFGVEEYFKYAVVFIGVIFFIIQMVVDVVDDMDTSYVEMALTSGYTNWEVFMRVVIPFASPRILDVLRINLSAAWTFLVAAELIGSEQGLGHFIAISQRFLRLDDLYAGIFAFGAIGLTTDFLLERLSRKVFPWYYITLKR